MEIKIGKICTGSGEAGNKTQVSYIQSSHLDSQSKPVPFPLSSACPMLLAGRIKHQSSGAKEQQQKKESTHEWNKERDSQADPSKSKLLQMTPGFNRGKFFLEFLWNSGKEYKKC